MIPKRVRMLKTVMRDIPDKPPVAWHGVEYSVAVNGPGVVAAILPGFDDALLGLKPGDFEVIEWREEA